MEREKSMRGGSLRALVALAAAVAWLAWMPAAQAQSDRDQTIPTGWWWIWENVDAAAINDRISQGFRLTDLEVVSVSPLRFDAVFVRNTGPYAKGFWWYHGVTAAQLSDFLADHGARLIDLEIYQVSGQTRFAAVMIPNTGADAAGWWWYYGLTAAQLGDFLADNNGRLIDLDTYLVNGQRRFTAVMIHNIGANARSWWWYYNVSPSFISSRLNANNARLIDIEPYDTANGTFAVVMEANPGLHWWWYYGVTPSQLANYLGNNGARLIDLEEYTLPGGATRYAAIMLNNSNELTTRIGDIMRTGTGDAGLYLKRVNGAVLADLQADRVFEPASTIKVLHHLHAMLRVQDGAVGLLTNLTVFLGLDGSCPQDTNPILEPLQTVLVRTMENSDNSRTQALRAYFGEANINDTAEDLGMFDTLLQHRIGCVAGADGALAEPNRLTLADAGRLYEAVADGILNDSLRDTFYQLMIDGIPSGLATIINQEAAAAGLSAAETAEFRSQFYGANKGGNYHFIVGSDNIYHRARAGWIRIPFRSRCLPTPREYVYGVFVGNASNDAAAADAINTGFSEILREQIRAAAQSWSGCCPADFNNDGSLTPADFAAFRSAFLAGSSAADFNEDGSLTPADFAAFRAAFLAGCP